MAQAVEARRRPRLSRERLLRAAVALADDVGLGALSMRKLAEELDVVPMALYKHVADKEELLDGMVDLIVREIDPPVEGTGWKQAMRHRILSARRSLRRHPWAPGVIESRTRPSPAVLAYIDSMIGLFLRGGFSPDLAHHAMHAMGSRLYGFTQEVFNDSQASDPARSTAPPRGMAEAYPHIAEMMGAIYHDPTSIVGGGCDDQFEFEFALDLLLDGLEKLV